MLTKLGKLTRQLRRRFSRSHLLSRWLGYADDHPESHEPGVILLQIDGLSQKQFEAALAKKRLPFLRKLLLLGYSRRMGFYSGLPSTTPAVQGEVMYGVKCAVPAFQFLHRKSGQVFRMFEHEAAKTIVEEHLSETEPLLKEGASYSNIYSGGAEEARCCAETTNLPSVLKELNPLRLLLMVFLYFFTLVRIAWLIGVELIVAIGDMIWGLITRRPDWPKEIKFVPTRVLVSVILREWVRIVVKLSITQGKPVIHANFLGYDEQAHRRGPSAAFAHWGLKGIDKVIEDIFKTAKRSDTRDYEVIVFSDHGQEEGRIYEFQRGETIQEAVKRSLQEGPLGKGIVQRIDWENQTSHLDQRMRRLMKIRRGQIDAPRITAEELANNVIVTALGPLGHIYFPLHVTDKVKAGSAQYLVERENVPLVLYLASDKSVFARNARGLWKLPEGIPQVCGRQHPFVQELAEDLICLCENPNAGDLIISGWDPQKDKESITFVTENGTHGSIGIQETQGFALIPKRIRIEHRETSEGEAYIRGLDLYHAAMRFLGRSVKTIPATNRVGTPLGASPERRNNSARDQRKTSQRFDTSPTGGVSPAKETRLRVMTYNTHHCVGLDGKCRPQRIAEVIADLQPDIVALQEMDVNRLRSGKRDQTRTIASHLGMQHHFFPVWSSAAEQYGLAVLSKLPLNVVREGCLTDACHRTKREARGAIWVSIETEHHGLVHVLNTHLGLRTQERLRQVEEILSERWLSDLHAKEPVIIAGDFNAGPKSPVMKKLSQHFQCVQLMAANHQPQRTFASMLPLRRIDYILVSRHFHVEGVSVPKDHFTKVASDHLPVCADLLLQGDLRMPGNQASVFSHLNPDGIGPVNASSGVS